ncbi:MAG: MFS transporter [Chloroflexota bacterium]
MFLNRIFHRVFYGWYVVGACLIIVLYTSGVVLYGFTSVFEPIAEEFEWSYAQISLAASLRGVEVGILAPLMGFMVDLWGPRRLVFGGSLIVLLGFYVLSLVNSIGMFYLAFAFISVGMSTCAGTVMVTAVMNWFRRRVGIATGIVVSGFGLGGLMVPLITWLIDTMTWRPAMQLLGIGMVVVVLPLSFVIRHKPEQYGYQPDGLPAPVNAADGRLTGPNPVETSVPVRQAVRGRPFWHLAIASLCHSTIVGVVVTHMMPFLSSIGMVRSVAAVFTLIVAVASIGGRLGLGWLGDVWDSQRVCAISFGLMTAGLLIFGFTSQPIFWLIIPIVLTYSLGWGGSVTLRMALMRKYYGRHNFGVILGLISGIMMLGNISGAPIAGWVYDTWGSYQLAWLGLAAVALLGSILILTLPQPESKVLGS